MTKEQWETCQRLVDAGCIEDAIPPLLNEIETRLSNEQLAKLGDIKSVLLEWSPKEKDLSIRGFVEYLIDLSQKGVIIGPKQ